MKKKVILLLVLALMLVGCNKKSSNLENNSTILTMKDGVTVTADDLYQKLKESDEALTEVINMVDKQILESIYADKIDEANDAADAAIVEAEEYFGDDLETYLQQYGYGGVDDYKELVYIGYLEDLAISDYCKDQITEKQIKKYYKDEVVGDIKVSHILITSKATDDMTDEEVSAAETEAKEKAESIIDELNKTSKSEVATKFAELAKEMSEDSSTADNGGSLGWINKGTLSSEYDELVTAAYNLKDGEYSTTVVVTELGYHVIMRTETKEKADLEDIKDDIIETLAEEYLEEHQVAKVKAMQELRKEYDLTFEDDSIKERYAEYIQEMLTYYQQQDESSDEDTTTTSE